MYSSIGEEGRGPAFGVAIAVGLALTGPLSSDREGAALLESPMRKLRSSVDVFVLLTGATNKSFSLTS